MTDKTNESSCTIEHHFDNSGIEGEEFMGEPRQRCEIWSRVMGYHRPVDQWNLGKQAEYEERTSFKEQ